MNKTRALCLSVSKRNQSTMDVVDDYSLHFNLPKSQTVFRIIREYHNSKLQESMTNGHLEKSQDRLIATEFKLY
jgi:hypothetical protein